MGAPQFSVCHLGERKQRKHSRHPDDASNASRGGACPERSRRDLGQLRASSFVILTTRATRAEEGPRTASRQRSRYRFRTPILSSALGFGMNYFSLTPSDFLCYAYGMQRCLILAALARNRPRPASGGKYFFDGTKRPMFSQAVPEP